MTKAIRKFLSRKVSVSKKNPPPIIVHWLESPSMEKPLAIIDKRVEYLLNKKGGAKKAKQWLLVDDKNFNAITAERYIINYLLQKNENIIDSLRPNGIDAYLDGINSRVGIEITTLNSFLGEWILVERLPPLLHEHNFLDENSLDITFSFQRINIETNGETINDYIKQVGRAILSSNMLALSDLEISVERIDNILGGGISWHLRDSDNVPWLDYLTERLYSKLKDKKKEKQLREFPRNLVFVGINHSSPPDGIFPRVFEYMGNNDVRFHPEIQEIEKYWASHMSDLTNVIGICYFFYHLSSETPFYPLKIFWRSEEDKIQILL